MSHAALAALKIAIAVGAIVLVVLGRARAARARERTITWAWVALAVLGTLTYFRFSPAAVTSRYDAYDLVHYYLNAKFFPELGYTHLYEACVVADREDRDRFRTLRSIRDLYDQRVRGAPALREIRSHPERVKRLFSPRRWRSFLRDFRVLDRRLALSTWERILVDRGYNATPTWHLIGHALASQVPARQLKALCHLDTLIVLLMFAVIGRTYGRRTLSIAVVWFTVSFSSGWPGVGAALLRYDWLGTSIAAACLLRRGRHLGAGALIGYATLQRIFPAIMLLGLFVKGAHALLAQRRLDRDALRAAAGFLSVVLLGGGLTFAVLGPEHFRSFRHDLEIQLAPENLSVNRMGLAVALAYRGETGNSELPLVERRERYLETGRMATARNVIGLFLLALLVVSLLPRGRRLPAREDDDVTQLGFLGFGLLLTASFYYWTLRLAMVLLHARHADASRWDTVGLCTLFGLEVYTHAFDLGYGFRYGLTASLSVLVSLYCAAVCLRRALTRGVLHGHSESATRGDP